jgi:PAS domain S-box-containing protein
MDDLLKSKEELINEINSLRHQLRHFKGEVGATDAFESDSQHLFSIISDQINNDNSHLAFDEIYNIDDLQNTQDTLSNILGVALVINDPDGNAITRPSGFRRFCRDYMQKSKIFKPRCMVSSKNIEVKNDNGPIITPCTSCGLWNGGITIRHNKHHLATWLVGQVRDKEKSFQEIFTDYQFSSEQEAKDIEAAFWEIPAMSGEEFRQIVNFLNLILNYFSRVAYQTTRQNKSMDFQKRIFAAFQSYQVDLSKSMGFIGDGSIVTDANGHIIFINQIAQELTGWMEYEATGKPLQEVFSLLYSEYLNEIQSFFTPKINYESAKKLNWNILLNANDGIQRKIVGQLVPINGDNNVLLGSVLGFRDITTSFEQEKVIQENENLLQSIFRTSPLGIGLSVDRKIAWANDEFWQLSGYAPEDFENQTSEIIYPSKSVFDEVGESIRDNFLKTDKWSIETQWKQKNGNIKDILLNLTPLHKSNGKVDFTFTALDITSQKKAEREQVSHQRFLESLLLAIPTPVFIKDVNGVYISCNRAFEDYFGITKDDLIGRNTTYWAPKDAEVFKEKDNELLKDPSIEQNYEYQLKDKNGHLRNVLFFKKAYRNYENEVDGIIGAFIDITERKIKEKSILRQAQVFQSINRLFQETLNAKTYDDILVYCVKLAEEMTGSSVGFIGEVDFEGKLINFQVSDHMKYQDFRTTLPRNMPLTGVRAHIMKQGKSFFSNDPYTQGVFGSFPHGHMHIKNILGVPFNINDERHGLIALANKENGFDSKDVNSIELLSYSLTEVLNRKQFEIERDRLQDYLGNIINSMPSVLIGVDENLKIGHWNSEAEKFTGVTFAEARGKDVNKLFPQMSEELKIINVALKERLPQRLEKIAFREGQHLRFFTITVFPLVSDHVDGAVIILDDVSERVRFEEMMIQNEKMVSVGGLAAGMAHEINNPLAGILQNVQVVRNRLTNGLRKNDEVAAKYGISIEALENYLNERGIFQMIEAIVESGQRAAQIVEDMLNFSRKSDSRKTYNDLCVLMDKSIVLASNEYNLKKHYDIRKVKISKEYDKDLPKILCDSTKIQQVLLNLIKNSAQAMFETGTKYPEITLRLKEEESMVRIEVEDNGPGIDEATQKRIFEPFFTTKSVGTGTGLGLSVSYYIIVENHNGQMDVESAPGGGTKFVIHLPIEEEK